MTIDRFEDLDCWKAARELVKLVYRLTSTKPFYNDFSLKDQIQRAAISAVANIAEGFATKSDKEFIRFLNYAARSAIEVQALLYVALDIEYIDQKDFDIVFNKAQDCANLCKGLARYLRKT